VLDECIVNIYHISNSVMYAGCVMTAHMTRSHTFVDSIDDAVHSKEITILMGGLFLKWPYKFFLLIHC